MFCFAIVNKIHDAFNSGKTASQLNKFHQKMAWQRLPLLLKMEGCCRKLAALDAVSRLLPLNAVSCAFYVNSGARFRIYKYGELNFPING